MHEHCSLFDEIYSYTGRFIAYPTKHSHIAHVLWIAHTYLIEAFQTTPRLSVISAEKQSGKTQVLRVSNVLVKQPIPMVNPSPASLFTLIEEKHPTLLIDEIDLAFEKKDMSDMTAILNSGFQRGQKVPRVVFEPKRTVEFFDVFGPIMIIGIDNNRMPDTVTDRSIPIRMKRRGVNEQPEPFRERDNAEEGYALAKRLEQWATDSLEKATGMKATLPKGIEDRNADRWEPLLICAECSGCSECSDSADGWVSKAWQAALAYLEEGKDIELSRKTLLLKDIRDIYLTTDTTLRIMNDRIPTEDLLRALRSIEDSPWDWLDGRALDARGLSTMLRAFGIHPIKIRVGEKTMQGYDFTDFYDTWSRYLPNRQEGLDIHPLQGSEQAEHSEQVLF